MNAYIYKPVLPKTLSRVAAFLIDFVLFLVLFTGVLYLISVITTFNEHYELMKELYIQEGYYILNESTGAYEMISQDAPNYEQVMQNCMANKALVDEIFYVRRFTLNAPLIACAIVLFITEFILPLIFKNGQTLGMKCFHIGLISKSNVRVKVVQLFARCVIGKIAVLGVVPLLALLYTFLSSAGGLLGTIIMLIIYGVHIAMLLGNPNKAGIQDIIASVYPVDLNQTIIYRNEKELADACRELSKSPYNFKREK